MWDMRLRWEGYLKIGCGDKLNIEVGDYLDVTIETGKIMLQKVDILPKKIDWESQSPPHRMRGHVGVGSFFSGKTKIESSD